MAASANRESRPIPRKTEENFTAENNAGHDEKKDSS
jgi:hypothetical protein